MSTHRAPGRARIHLDNAGRFITSPRVRAYVYGISIPVIALLIGVGALTEGTAGLILDVIAAVLGIGTSALAVANTPTNGSGGGGLDGPA